MSSFRFNGILIVQLLTKNSQVYIPETTMIITDNLTFDLIAILVSILVGVIAYLKWKLTYWEKVGLPTLNPTLPFGDTKDLLLGRKSFGEQFQEIYRQLRAKKLKHAGIYSGVQATYMPTDPEIIKHIMQIDFQHFVNHGNYIDEHIDPLSGNLLNLEDEKWRNMRVKLTPTFTSGKMKMMFETMVACTSPLKFIMDDSAISHKAVDIKEVLSRFTTDVIGSVAFGIECNSLTDPDAEFRKYGKKAFEARLRLLLPFVTPHKILKFFKFKTIRSDVETFFMKAVRDTVEYREKNNIYRKDFMHLLLQLKNRGTVTDDQRITDDHGKSQEKALTMNEVAAQAFVFFFAGFETSATTMTFALYELAANPDVQTKLRNEINTVLSKNDGKLSYNAIMEMTYMDKVLYETLRKYPPIGALNRKCTKDYIIPNTTILLKKGTDVLIPVLGIQTDPEYYPNPEKFDPERFSEENKHSRPAFTWIPFGEGPRVCIGSRFGLLQSKVGLTTLLKDYKITLNRNTKLPLKMDKTAIIPAAEGGIWLNVEKLE